MGDPTSAREIEQAVQSELARRGTGGTVVLSGTTLELHGAGPIVAIEIGEWVEQWQLLPPDMRDRRIESAALRLHQSLARSLPPPKQKSALYRELPRVLGGLVVLAALATGGWWLYTHNFFGAHAATEASGTASPSAPILDPRDRATHVCEAARKRLYAGASMGMVPDGWIVELWLARDDAKGPLAEDRALRQALEGDRITVGLSAELGAIAHGKVAIVPDADAALGASSAIVRFEGGYVAPYVDAAGRDRYLAMAATLADAVHADYAALYGRCAHLRARDWGAWYRGPGAAGAAAAVLQAAGAYAEPAVFDAAKATGEGGLLARLTSATKGLGEREIEEVTRTAGGKLDRGDVATTGVDIIFPLGGPTRAIQAARTFAERAALR